MKQDFEIIHQALTAAKNIAFAHRRGGLHNLYPQLVEGLEALKRIEKKVTTQPMPLFQLHDTADYKRQIQQVQPQKGNVPQL